MSDQPQEIEAALFICSDRPAAVADDIAQLDRLGAFTLVAEPDQFIRDIHFDAGETIPWMQGIALRARQKNQTRLITLKGPPQVDAAGLVTRLEVESPWNSKGVARVTSALQALGMTIPPLPDSLDESDPAATLEANGFRIIQARATHRRVRRIAVVGAHAPLAEMDIDAIRYAVGERTVACFEIEIEAKAENAETIIEPCTRLLLSRFARLLRPWPYGKLLTGKSIAQLLANGELEPLLEAGDIVGPVACDAIESYIRLTRQLPAQG
jgi:hypothetical protein